jgi:RNA polymerase sigma-70 factor (ECF subfamily)
MFFRNLQPGRKDEMSALQEALVMESSGLQKEFNINFVDSAATDEALVAASKRGHRSSFVELWTRHSNRAFKMVYRITGNRDDAEDAIQEAWMKAYMHLNTFDGRAKFSTWLTRIAINSALMTLRKKRAHPETSMDWSPNGEPWQQWEMADKRANVEEQYLRKERERHLRLAIHRLRPALRTIVEIQQAHGSSVKEMSEVAGISVAAAKSRLLRARTVLRRSLRESEINM